MARKIWIMALMGIIFSAGIIYGTDLLTNGAGADDVKVDEVARQSVLDATMRITLFAPALDEEGNEKIFEVNGEKQRELAVGEGLGTLLRVGGKTIIITHDHWSLLTENLYKVQFHSAGNDLLLELEGSMFHSLIRYRDGGTLVLAAPEQVSTQMSAVQPAGEAAALQQGESLLIAYWQPGFSEPVGVEPVVVESTEQHRGLPSINMKSLNGKAVINGNSGGGVFLNGRLVGNMWTTSIELQLVDGEESGIVRPTTMSRATQLADGRFFASLDAAPVALWQAHSEG